MDHCSGLCNCPFVPEHVSCPWRSFRSRGKYCFHGHCWSIGGYGIYRLLRDTSVHIFITVFLVTALADIFTYITTSFELALAYPAETGGFFSSFTMFMVIFAVTQVPLAIVEGIVLALVFKYILALKPDILIRLNIFSEEKINAARGED